MFFSCFVFPCLFLQNSVICLVFLAPKFDSYVCSIFIASCFVFKVLVRWSGTVVFLAPNSFLKKFLSLLVSRTRCFGEVFFADGIAAGCVVE